MKNQIKIATLFILLLTSFATLAQGDDEDPETPPGDPGEAPLDVYIPLLVAGAIAIGYRFLPQSKSENIKS